MKRLMLILLAAALLLGCPAFASGEASAAAQEETEYPVIETDVKIISKYGNLALSISGKALMDQGYGYMDIIHVSVAGNEVDMPIASSFNDVEVGNPVCVVYSEDSVNGSTVLIAMNMGDFATEMHIAEKQEMEEDPGYCWSCLVPEPVTVQISMKKKNGYADDALELELIRTNVREDYPNLTDEQYANFRNVRTTGTGSLTLYRSSSPVDPQLNRNHEADEALNNAGIQTIINLTNTETTMKAFADYQTSYYSQRDIIALNMDLSFTSDRFKKKLAEGISFMAAHEGPYLVHCTEGKDRCGFVSALLECLMGASLEEISADYMITYYNYYGIRPGTEEYEKVLDRYFRSNLKAVFETEDLEHADLVKETEEYLESAGVDRETIEALKSNLSRSWDE